MNPIMIIIYTLLYGLSFLCFLVPQRSGHKSTGTSTGIILGILISTTLICYSGFLIAFIIITVLSFQIIFLIYWIFRFFKRRKAGNISVIILTIAVLLLFLSPWISDWIFNKNDVRRILGAHHIELKDHFKLLENESGGLRNYYETFTKKLSDKDYKYLFEKFRNSKNYQGTYSDYRNVPNANHENFDTVDFETKAILIVNISQEKN